tara:strand:- start:230 stop:679 length:450 start_codon:yes stop_codon:yes gene_type:complete
MTAAMSPKNGDQPCPPGLSSGTVRMPSVIAPIPAKKITPKLVIPVIPVCKFKEKAKIENIQTKTIIRDICIDLVKFVTLGSNQARYARIIKKNANVSHEPRSLERPYCAFEAGIIADQRLRCMISKALDMFSVRGLIEYNIKKIPSHIK